MNGNLGKIDKIRARYEQLLNKKQVWLYSWQQIGQYVMTKKQNFLKKYPAGVFLTGSIFDESAPTANHLLASAVIGALWPNGGRSFRFDPPRNMDAKTAQSREVQDWYQYASNCVAQVMDNPKLGFLTAFEEYMLDQGSFGTSAMGVEPNDANADGPVRYFAVDVKSMAIDEGADGFIDTVYRMRDLTAHKIVEEYTYQKCSQAIRSAFDAGNFDQTFQILHAIEPRVDRYPQLLGNNNAPWMSTHLEFDTGNVLRESGYYELPIKVARFQKGMDEIYGRSPAFECMPAIVEANILRQSLILATEKMLNPPLIVTHDGTAGGGKIDTSAGAINVKHISGRIAETRQKVVEPIITIGELKSTQERIKELRGIIQDNFYIDRLTDLNNDQRMTLGEANIRNMLRGQSLNIIYSRQMAEMLNPIIERTLTILFNAGHFKNNPPPPAVQELLRSKQDAYKITWLSPAARTMKIEELTGLQQVMQATTELAAMMPTVMDNFDTDKIALKLTELTGAPSEILRSAEDIAKLRASRNQQQMAQAQLEANKIHMEAARAGAKALLDSAKAGVPADQGLSMLGGAA